jgi:hypothetical protein
VIQIENELLDFRVKIVITRILHFDGDMAALRIRILFVILVFVVGAHAMVIAFGSLFKVVSVPF